MTLVIDASVACTWFFNEPLAAEARIWATARRAGARDGRSYRARRISPAATSIAAPHLSSSSVV